MIKFGKFFFIRKQMNKNRKIIKNGPYIYWMICVLFEYETKLKNQASVLSFMPLPPFERFLQESTRLNVNLPTKRLYKIMINVIFV